MEIKTKIKTIRHFDKNSGYCVCVANNGSVFTGVVHHENPKKELLGVDIVFDGENVTNKYGTSFSFGKYTIKEDFHVYFLTTMVKGIPKKSANLIIKRFGENLGEIIENSPSQLLSIKGIGQKNLSKIVESYVKSKHLRKLSDFLLPFGVSSTLVKKIYNHYDEEGIEKAIPKLRNNPYLLTRIKGIGFKKADEIALGMGVEPNSEFRIDSGLLYVLSFICSEGGHTFIHEEELISMTKEELGVETGDTLENGFSKDKKLNLIEEDMLPARISILEEKNALKKIFLSFPDGTSSSIISPLKLYKAELYIYNVLSHLRGAPSHPVLSEEEFLQFIKEAEANHGFSYSEEQKSAIALANSDAPIMFLHGLAGSGKTTTSTDLMRLHLQRVSHGDIFCCSLSGVASQKVRTLTGFNGGTIHSLLGMEEGRFKYNEANKLPYRIILVDELSMVDSWLFSRLLMAIDFVKTKVFLVGDSSQLQSVSEGNVLYDIVHHQGCDGYSLEKVHRQSEEQIINVLATEYIRQGRFPDWIKNEGHEDFRFIPVEIENMWERKKKLTRDQWHEVREENNLSIRAVIGNLSRDVRKKHMDYYANKDILGYLSAFMVLTPMKKHTLGVHQLNNYLQSILNPFNHESVVDIAYGDRSFTIKPRDKIMHLENKFMVASTPDAYKLNASSDAKIVSWYCGQNSEMDEVASVGDVQDPLNMFKLKIYNGQLGVVIKIIKQGDSELKDDLIIVYYPAEQYLVYYTRESFLMNIASLSWCMSIHKSQGSQFEDTALIMSYSHYKMLNNQLTYTATTRAKDMLTVVGEESAFKRACTNIEDTQRNTILGLLFQGAIKP